MCAHTASFVHFYFAQLTYMMTETVLWPGENSCSLPSTFIGIILKWNTSGKVRLNVDPFVWSLVYCSKFLVSLCKIPIHIKMAMESSYTFQHTWISVVLSTKFLSDCYCYSCIVLSALALFVFCSDPKREREWKIRISQWRLSIQDNKKKYWTHSRYSAAEKCWCHFDFHRSFTQQKHTKNHTCTIGRIPVQRAVHSIERREKKNKRKNYK